ncbi:protein adenylyltransferase SelO [Comamonas aquatica]|uniref:protein adenylyltransferase SelO n=1 Tax=Comamonas aquatica TaxID=225991 RepID=UPI003A4C561B
MVGMHSPDGSPTPDWHTGFAALGPAFLTHLPPTPLPAPAWVAHSEEVAQLVGLPPGFMPSETALQAFSGNTVLPGSQPYASVYSGHQFGVWAGQLGDGRALHLGETTAGWELQLKGAGRTPYSRGGDGRAVLRSSIREFLCSEAMHALGIPTTRALCLTASHAPVHRETMETAAVVTRAAPSFIRFGHFEHFAARDMQTELRALADYVIDRYDPDCRQGWSGQDAEGNTLHGNAYAALLHAIGQRTATLLAHWQAVGFCHGVMNTDNMSVLGLTIDYGPFQFLDGFDPGHICNHSDHQGRYAFNKQPQIAYWNLFCLGQALLPLIEDQDVTVAALEAYRPAFSQAFRTLVCRKLGLPGAELQHEAAATATIGQLLELLAAQRVDHSIFWRRLSLSAQDGDPERTRELFLDTEAFDRWLLTYQELSTQMGQAPDADLMLHTNPAFVLRNHVGELAIRAAQQGDFSVVQSLHQVLRTPFDDHPAHRAWADFPPDWASSIAISCSS